MKTNEAMEQLLEEDEVTQVLKNSFYRPVGQPRGSRRRKSTAAESKPNHYKVICISTYVEDLARMDAMVSQLKEAGHRKMNRSALIRFALDQVDLSKLPKSY